MRKQSIDLRQTDMYQNVYSKHQDLKESKRLRDKYSEKPYRVRFRLLRNLSLGTSVIANLLSAATASIAVYFFLNEMLHHTISSVGLTVLLLFILELAKRTTGKTLFVDFNRDKKDFPFLHLLILVSLTATSIILSYNGGKRTAQQFIEEPNLYVEENYTKTYEEALAKIDQLIDEARKTTYNGTNRTTNTSQRTIELLTKQRSEAQDKLFDIRAEVAISNKKIKTDFNTERAEKGRLFALITIFVEGLFLCCLFYVERYDYKSYIELPSTDTDNTLGVIGSMGTNQIDTSIELQTLLQEIILPLKEELIELRTSKQSNVKAVSQQELEQENQVKVETVYKSKTPSNLNVVPIVAYQKIPQTEAIKSSKVKRESTIVSKDQEALKKQIRTKKNGISKAKSRLNSGEGNPQTHQNNIYNWTAEVSKLEKVLNKLKAADENRPQN